MPSLLVAALAGAAAGFPVVACWLADTPAASAIIVRRASVLSFGICSDSRLSALGRRYSMPPLAKHLVRRNADRRRQIQRPDVRREHRHRDESVAVTVMEL